MPRFVRRPSGPRAIALGLAAAAGFTAVAQAGPVNIINSERTLRASVTFGGRAEVSDTVKFEEAGVFNDSVSVSDEGEGFAGNATASMNSNVGQNGFFSSGTLSFAARDARPSLGEEGRASMSFDVRVEFSIDEPYAFDFSSDLTNEVSAGGGASATDSSFRILGGDSSDPVLIENVGSGVLQPGTYSLLAFDTVETTRFNETERSYSVDYDVSLDLSPVDGGNGGGGGEPNPIPLPPAVWSGLAVIGAGALNRLRKRRTA